MRFVILHYHIFKNAGSTVEDILDHSFGDRFGGLETKSGSGLVSNPELFQFLIARPELRAFSSHQIRYPVPEAPGFLFFDICFLRDPLDRLRSFYDYFRQRPNPDDPMSDLANRCTLDEFVVQMIRDHSLFVKNNQVNLLACGGDSDEPGEIDLELAVRRIRSCAFLGVVDCFGQSVTAGAAALLPAFPDLDCRRAPVNVSRGLQGFVSDRIDEMRQACSPDVYEELLSVTELDRRLLEFARHELTRRRADAPVRARPPGRPKPASAKNRDIGYPTKAKRLLTLLPYWKELSGTAGKTLFDAEYYRTENDASNGYLHFLTEGAWQGRRPHPLFDPAYYLRKYPDVAAARVNPFAHYLKRGYKEQRQPHPLFDPTYYLDQNPDVRRAELNPLLHYLRHGAAEDRKPHPLFDPKYYRKTAKTLQEGENPLIHFIASGAGAASPHPLFNCDAYLDAHPDLAEQGVNPLVHYLESSSEGKQAIEGTFSVKLEIQDVTLEVFVFDNTLVDPTARPGRNQAIVWQDAQGFTHWIAERQQQPLLRAIPIGQIRAQKIL